MLAAYLRRIGLPAFPQRDPAGLEAVQRAHRLAISFENFDIPLGRGIAIDSDSVFAKLVNGARGGYCFEQNRLLSDMLALSGLATRPLLARVWLGAVPGVAPPRTHVLLLAELEGAYWIVDAGFGGSYVPVLPLADGAMARTSDGASHRLRRRGQAGTVDGEWVLERAAPAAPGEALSWQAQYSFDLSEVAPVDLARANLWTSTAPGTRFTSAVIASRPLANGFATLFNAELATTHATGTERRAIGDVAAYAAMLRDVFGITLAEDELGRWPIFD